MHAMPCHLRLHLAGHYMPGFTHEKCKANFGSHVLRISHCSNSNGQSCRYQLCKAMSHYAMQNNIPKRGCYANQPRKALCTSVKLHHHWQCSSTILYLQLTYKTGANNNQPSSITEGRLQQFASLASIVLSQTLLHASCETWRLSGKGLCCQAHAVRPTLFLIAELG